MAEYINDIYLNMKNLYLITLHQTTKTNISQLTTSQLNLLDFRNFLPQFKVFLRVRKISNHLLAVLIIFVTKKLILKFEISKIYIIL